MFHQLFAGLTPHRRTFHYPDSLPRTQRHGLLLEDFRHTYILEEATNTQIPDDDDSLSSQSVVSRLPELDGEEATTQTNNDGEHDISIDFAIGAMSHASSMSSVNQVSEPYGELCV